VVILKILKCGGIINNSTLNHIKIVFI